MCADRRKPINLSCLPFLRSATVIYKPSHIRVASRLNLSSHSGVDVVSAVLVVDVNLRFFEKFKVGI